VAALRHACEGAHPELRELVGAERLGGQVLVLSCELQRSVGQLLRRQLVRTGVREVTSAICSLGDRRCAFRFRLEGVVAADEH
jgi:hypothetical protein